MDFYTVEPEYIDFLKSYEKKHRGVTKVPDVNYYDRNKFTFGAVLQINNMNYYVSVSSFKSSQEANILIRVPGDKEEIKGSLRFNYMIPVPDQCLNHLKIKEIPDKKYRDLLNKEYLFCIKNQEKITAKASKIYAIVTNKKKPILVDNSCDFKLLEKAHDEYLSIHKDQA